MKVQSILVAFLFLLLGQGNYCQINSKSEILKASKLYYESLRIFSVMVVEKFKPPVAEDTSISKHRCLINRLSGDKLFLGTRINKGMFIRNQNEILIDLDEKSYQHIKNKDRRFTAYSKLHQFYPFVDVDDFFSRISNKNLSIRETATEYILSNNSYLCEFRKSDFSIKRFANFGFEKKFNGSWYEETNFSECAENDSIAATYIDKAVEIVLSNENEEAYGKEKKHAAPKTFDRTILSKPDMRIVNYLPGNINNKIIFIDFFYSSCIPCYKSHPLVNKLHENSDSNFIVIGVDPMLSDTLHIQQFLDRFSIKHPVVIGEDALKISRIPGVVSGYPTFLVIDLDGKVLEYKNGHSEKFLKDIERKYLNKKKPANSKVIRGA